MLEELESLEADSAKLEWLLNFVDSHVFPQDPIPVKPMKEKSKSTCLLHFDRDKEGGFINQYYAVNKEKVDGRKNKLESLIEIAIHEVRHRVQREKDIKRITRKSFREFDNKYALFKDKDGRKLSDIIDEIYPNFGLYQYDAKLIGIVSQVLFRKGVSLKDIVEKIVRPDAKMVMENLRVLLEKQ